MEHSGWINTRSQVGRFGERTENKLKTDSHVATAQLPQREAEGKQYEKVYSIRPTPSDRFITKRTHTQLVKVYLFRSRPSAYSALSLYSENSFSFFITVSKHEHVGCSVFNFNSFSILMFACVCIDSTYKSRFGGFSPSSFRDMILHFLYKFLLMFIYFEIIAEFVILNAYQWRPIDVRIWILWSMWMREITSNEFRLIVVSPDFKWFFGFAAYYVSLTRKFCTCWSQFWKAFAKVFFSLPSFRSDWSICKMFTRLRLNRLHVSRVCLLKKSL